MTPYHDLTVRGKARRLRRMVDQLLAGYDLDVVRVSLLSNDLNGVFRVDTAGGERLVVRILLPEPEVPVAAQLVLVDHLGSVTDLDLPRAVRDRGGTRFRRLSADDVPGERIGMVTRWVPGSDLAARVTPDRWRALGRLSATLHDATEGWAPPEGPMLPVYDRVVHLGEPVVLFDPVADPFLTADDRRVLAAGIERINTAIAALDGNRLVAHCDLHQWNVKHFRGRLGPIDFDDIGWAHPIQDVAITLYYVHRRPDYQDLLEAFRRGYTERRRWVERRTGELDLHIAARGVDLVNYVIWSPEDDAADYSDLIGRVVSAVEAATSIR